MSDTSCGLPVIVESFLAEFFGLIGGLIVFLLEKTNTYCKAHGANAIIWGIIYCIMWVIMVIFGAICRVGGVVATIFGILCAIISLIWFCIWVFNWVMALIKAQSQEFVAFPIVSGFALKMAGN
ncbi:hypothetical protein EIN_344920 [Entamoeba invadens IP1]|uniref:DUF4870 domain-containing protein n=1 Tax=Entamoeba invadens IP1 TaxID=370355 RepID=A0A0A1U3B2_ENTIV|nr:hypothetical protein EIN_344920 [Entamoeba invadens IP1]ELP88532.1 hypothetical protein EIN_344920 [Entamoeba invadens IP1]|eukprot:XP_004255303.1 hypothetical protein EIN_344920 [Entamoeba invadens IP1]